MQDEAVEEDRVRERGLLTVADEVWAAVGRAEVIGRLAGAEAAGKEAVAAAEELGLRGGRSTPCLVAGVRAAAAPCEVPLPATTTGLPSGQVHGHKALTCTVAIDRRV